MKVTVIGAGSSYTPELINGFLERFEQFPLDELWLMDVLPERLEVVGGFAQRMVAAHGAPFRVILSTDQRAAVAEASYVWSYGGCFTRYPSYCYLSGYGFYRPIW